MPASTRPRPGSNAPDPSHYTRSVALHPIRRGAMPTDRVFRLPKQVQPRAFTPDTPKRQHQTLPDNLEIPARLRTRGAAPVTSRYTRYVAMHLIRRGAMPTDRVHRFIDNKRDRGELCPAPATPASNRSSVPHSGVTVWWSARLIWVRSPCDPSRKLSTSDSK